MGECLISVIVPVYNGSAYIEGLMEQFADQPMDGIELVCVDDGSADNSHEKLLQIAAYVPFAVRVYHQKNKGVSAARNLGVEKAEGKYIAFLDVDDGVSPDYIHTLRTHALMNVDLLVFSSDRVKEDFTRQVSDQKECCWLTKNEMLNRFWSDPTRLGVVNLLIRKRYMTEISAVSSEGYKYYEDYDLLLQLFAQTDSICFLDRVLYYYIQRDGSAMGRFNAERINCLALMKARGEWLWDKAPEFALVFQKWGTSRLYWSVLWQAALALPKYRDFLSFAKLTHAKNYLKKLKGYPDGLLRLSSAVFLLCPAAYHLAVRFMGRAKSSVHPTALEDIRKELKENLSFY